MPTDLLIIGGGVIGLSCALHVLADHPHWDIALIDRPTNSGVASRAAAGMLSPFGECGCESPFFNLCREALAEYPEFLRRFAPEVPLSMVGTLVPREDDRAERFDELLEFLSRISEPHRVLRGAELRTAEPALSQDIKEAIWVREGLVDARLLHDALTAAALRAGVRIQSAGIESFASHAGRVTHAILDSGDSIAARHFLIAAGAWSPALGESLGLRLEVRPFKGQVALLESPSESFLQHMVRAHHIYIAPRPGAGIVCGATVEDVGFDDSVSADVARDLAFRAAELAPELCGARVLDSWIGFRPRTTDGLPAIGPSSVFENLFLATGHFRNGILLAGITGKLVAAAMNRGAGAVPGEFLPGRFGL